jgi:hypothetical protein
MKLELLGLGGMEGEKDSEGKTVDAIIHSLRLKYLETNI